MLDVKLGSVVLRLYRINIDASKARPSVNVIVSVVCRRFVFYRMSKCVLFFFFLDCTVLVPKPVFLDL